MRKSKARFRALVATSVLVLAATSVLVLAACGSSKSGSGSSSSGSGGSGAVSAAPSISPQYPPYEGAVFGMTPGHQSFIAAEDVAVKLVTVNGAATYDWYVKGAIQAAKAPIRTGSPSQTVLIQRNPQGEYLVDGAAVCTQMAHRNLTQIDKADPDQWVPVNLVNPSAGSCAAPA